MNLLQRLGERFWFIPAVMCAAAFVLAHGLVALDRLRGDPGEGWLSVLLYRVGESGSRDILGAIASSSLAVAGTTFSITMAVLALTSSSYGPRLVRNFMADRGNQTVLGVYVSTFLYSLLVLRSVRVIGDPGNPDAQVFVPHLAVNAAVVLAVGNVAVLIYFIHHISDSIQISTLAGAVRADLLATIDRLYPADVGRGGSPTDRPASGGDGFPALDPLRATPVTAERSGYVQFVRDDDLMAAARDHDVVVVLRVRPGQYVLEDTVVALVHGPSPLPERLPDAVRSAIQVGDARSPHQDPEFAVQQLTEMAVRALSPGTNDPYTAVNALDDLSVALCRLAAREAPSVNRLDDAGTLRVVAPRVETVDLVGSVMDSMRWYAPSAPSVMLATLVVLGRVGAHARSPRLREELVTHVDLLQEAFVAAGHHRTDVRRFADEADSVRAGLRRA